MKIEHFFIDNNIDLTGKTLLIATSGGPDSMALSQMLVELSKKIPFKIVLAHFDHQLRDDSGQETELIDRYAKEHNLILNTGSWQKKSHPENGIEAAARKARYQFLSEVALKYHVDYLLTAHHGDDLIENILLKFIRSGNPEEMNSLKAVSKMNGISLLRPLLSFSKDELLDYVSERRIDFIQDSTNLEDDTLRNRLRHHVVPLLKNENANLVKNAMRYSSTEDSIISFASEKFKEIGNPKLFLGKFFVLAQNKLQDLNEEQKNLYWQNFIWHNSHLRSGANLADYSVKLYQNNLYLWKNSDLREDEQKKNIFIDQYFTFYNRQFILTRNKLGLVKLGDFWSDQTSFYVQSIPAGYRLLLKNLQHVKAKKMFAESKIPNELRKFCLTIFDSKDQVVFIEKTYGNQLWSDNANHYYIYEIENDKKTLKE